MFSRILVANRGEIALRVIRACRELGIETVAVYSERDKDSIYLRFADETICIGPSNSAASYLEVPNIISAAEISDVEAIHPGYGFLAENSHFAEVCRSCKIGFIGPSPEAIDLVGNKAQARALAQKVKVPVIPGSEGIVETEEEALEVAHRVGFPVMIKAALGGGGKGMRVAHNDISLINGFFAAKAEAEAAFKDASIYIEKLIEKARHIEFQIVADNYGNIVHLGERDCSIQRRHQKLIEEAPSPVLTPDLRETMGACAVALARAADYTNVGTVEFLLDRDRNFYFVEINARIQVEHPVTEAVTGIDLVREQIRIAAGEPFELKQEDIILKGVAIECRINAEDPHNNFQPSPGSITMYCPPGGIGIRVDSHVYTGYQVPPHYDSLIGKLIVTRNSRNEAIQAMKGALDEFVIEGIQTTIPLYLRIFEHSSFINGEFDTTFLEKVLL